MSNSSFWSMRRTLSGATTLGQIRPENDGNEGVLRNPQSSSITLRLMLHPGHSLGGGSYPTAEMLSVYSMVPANWVNYHQSGASEFRQVVIVAPSNKFLTLFPDTINYDHGLDWFTPRVFHWIFFETGQFIIATYALCVPFMLRQRMLFQIEDRHCFGLKIISTTASFRCNTKWAQKNSISSNYRLTTLEITTSVSTAKARRVHQSKRWASVIFKKMVRD